ncbi:Protein VAC14-like [Hondaea fermentalgiana]|uniref:Protein VAC14-like n=1 Tax=Hondaea fermentalgiana TaxID=2315210 RepID=A0A2R5GV04_9STRA|nr:Protein VAC14-like [Hondaea fermentalgiana]|eukprot:GBG31744.1 Protein VAC14-like [Hondaea fermentalgiana]
MEAGQQDAERQAQETGRTASPGAAAAGSASTTATSSAAAGSTTPTTTASASATAAADDSKEKKSSEVAAKEDADALAAATQPSQQHHHQQQHQQPQVAKPQAFVKVVLSQGVMRGLSDRSYEKRKAGAIEIERIVREKSSGPNADPNGAEYVVTLINILTMDYACSMNSSQRKGGLIGLAAVALGLGPSNTPKYLQYLLPPILKCFDDPEARVRYYACEALYNVAKVARKHVLAYFNALFDGLFRLFTDLDVDVKNGAQLLDRLMKEIVTENSDTFQVSTFVPLLEKHLVKSNPYTRQFLIGWILALDSIPNIDFLNHLPKVLEGIFNMLSDQKREIRMLADKALTRFLAEIQQADRDNFEKDIILAIVNILTHQCATAQKFTRLTAVMWIQQLLDIFQEQLTPAYASIAGVLLNCLSDSEADIKSAADKAHTSILELVRSGTNEFTLRPLINVVTEKLSLGSAAAARRGGDSPPATAGNPPAAGMGAGIGNGGAGPSGSIADLGLGAHASGESAAAVVPLPTRMAALTWILMLLDKYPNEMMEHLERLTPAMLTALSDPSDDLVVQDLEVLARIARNTSRMDEVVGQVVTVFREDRGLFDSRGSFVIRKLCVLLEPSTVYLILAKEVDKESDMDFAHLMVQTLNLILLTGPELGAFRARLKRSWRICCGEDRCGDEDKARADSNVFVTLYKTWCFDPVATLSLCLLAQSYHLSSLLVTRLADTHVTVGILMEIDKLVQLIESPAFLNLRLELVNTGSSFRPALLRTLYGLLMILPQGNAYGTLSNRLNDASAMHLAIASNGSHPLRALMAADAGTVSAPKTVSSSSIPSVSSSSHTGKKKFFGKLGGGGGAGGGASNNAVPDAGSEPEAQQVDEDPEAQRREVEAQLLEHFITVQSQVISKIERAIHAKSLVGLASS